MYTALYYPHSEIRNLPLLKTALLLWDRIEYIVPWSGFRQSATGMKGKALGLIADPYTPSDEDKTRAHEAILDLVTNRLPDSFLLDQVPSDQIYPIYAAKLLPDTWRELFNLKLVRAKSMGDFDDIVASRNLGLAIMGLLAECCAGNQKRRVTDRERAYEVVAKSVVGLHHGTFTNAREDVERLVTITLEVVDCTSIPLRNLIEFREQENKEGGGGHAIRELRHEYLQKIDSYVCSLGEAGSHQGDRQELLRLFKQSVQDDIAKLREALKLKATDLLLSKEVGVGLLAAAGIAITPWTVGSGILGIGALLRGAKIYDAERKKAMRENAMSWLLGLTQSGFRAY